MKASVTDNFETLLHFLNWADEDLIKKVWNGDVEMQRHLGSKLKSRQVESLVNFILGLDMTNRHILYKYIEENHSNK